MFTIFLIGNIPIILDYPEAFLELLKTILLYHIFFKFCKFTGRYIDHLLVRATHFFHLLWIITIVGFILFGVLVTIRVINWRLSYWLVIATYRALLRIWSLWYCISLSVSISTILLEPVYIIHVHLIKKLWILTVLWLIFP